MLEYIDNFYDEWKQCDKIPFNATIVREQSGRTDKCKLYNYYLTNPIDYTLTPVAIEGGVYLGGPEKELIPFHAIKNFRTLSIIKDEDIIEVSFSRIEIVNEIALRHLNMNKLQLTEDDFFFKPTDTEFEEIVETFYSKTYPTISEGNEYIVIMEDHTEEKAFSDIDTNSKIFYDNDIFLVGELMELDGVKYRPLFKEVI